MDILEKWRNLPYWKRGAILGIMFQILVMPILFFLHYYFWHWMTNVIGYITQYPFLLFFRRYPIQSRPIQIVVYLFYLAVWAGLGAALATLYKKIKERG